MKVRDIYNIIDNFAPFASQIEYDHSGLQVGDMQADVTGLLFAVDLSDEVIDEAVALGYNTIVVHHPPIWTPLVALTQDEYTQRLVRRLIRADLHCIAAHTNVDKCEGGNSERLVRLLGGVPCGRLDCDEYAVTFVMPAMPMHDLVDRVRVLLPDPHAYGVGKDNTVGGGALCTGSGYSRDAMCECADKGLVYMTAEVKHHDLRAAEDMGVNMVVFGHYAGEHIFTDIMVDLFAGQEIPCRVSRQKDPCGISYEGSDIKS